MGGIKSKKILIIGIVCLLLVVACDSRPYPLAVKAWPQSFRQAILEGYIDFKGYYIDDDAAVYIFGYRLPSKLITKDVFEKLVKRLDGDGYKVISITQHELVMRRAVSYSKDSGFDEYRFFVQDESGRVIVMFANLDSKGELNRHKEFVDEFYKISQSNSH